VFSSYLQDANGATAEILLSFSDCTLILILPLAFGVLLFLVSFRLPSPSHRFLSEHQAVEFTWTLLPALSLFLIAAPSLSLLYALDEVGCPVSTSKVQGHQWFWVYEYSDTPTFSTESYLSPGPLRLLSSDGLLTVASGLILRLLITAADVLHSWTIPSWGLKADAVPGRLNSLGVILDRPGVFYGQCSEICGRNHSFIPIQAEVVDVAVLH
jgi:cytochrome c oxidase subunit 2